ncbi:hypothetical protein SISSUDRAFT_1066712 [Sistotremastrum suecicum HHB10207 ss-3]|uniref:Uncharacterized protein n=1 Tax=Sistotremastrum suecicum HHB10207 ss-3 TaxID=1314776 RepID=A0A165XZ33_9AGAM|nr:hypothetical protein SISSUDRAFT_1066712 [Sistotremastrum suecicum HHB10207 ss-3]
MPSTTLSGSNYGTNNLGDYNTRNANWDSHDVNVQYANQMFLYRDGSSPNARTFAINHASIHFEQCRHRAGGDGAQSQASQVYHNHKDSGNNNDGVGYKYPPSTVYIQSSPPTPSHEPSKGKSHPQYNQNPNIYIMPHTSASPPAAQRPAEAPTYYQSGDIRCWYEGDRMIYQKVKDPTSSTPAVGYQSNATLVYYQSPKQGTYSPSAEPLSSAYRMGTSEEATGWFGLPPSRGGGNEAKPGVLPSGYFARSNEGTQFIFRQNS